MAASRWQQEAESSSAAAEAELNLVPYLDIMVNLVIFLLFSFQVVIEVCRIDLLAPAYGEGGGSSSAATTITLAIHQNGYTVLSSDAAMGVIDIPLKDGDYDRDELHTKLVDWKRTYALPDNVIITAEPRLSYEIVVRTMDAIRLDGHSNLFPGVTLARAAGEVEKR
ncbi:MAG: biopolymer transporter ExbD [Deltaproteobacteria bacterium]|nr:biopolymer transporter ExbD [Deltaproteobacteria bacterium]